MNFFSSGSGSKQHVPSKQPIVGNDTYYFAYGSNLHVTQMANRCPASIFKGKGVLSGYRWQINERGVANVVKSSGDSVEGLIYLVNRKDEKSLDRSEGVSRGFYQKQLLSVAFEPNKNFMDCQSFEVAQLIVQSDESSPGYAKTREDRNSNKNIKALVYISENYTSDGIIRKEYIQRIQNAMVDAEILGVSRSFFSKYVIPFLDERNQIAPPPNHAEGGGKTLGSRGNDGSTRAGAKRPKVSENHEGERYEGQRHEGQRQEGQKREGQKQEGQKQEGQKQEGQKQEGQKQEGQRQEGQISGKPRPQFSEGNTDSLDLVDFTKLERANRDPHADSGLKFPTDMLDAIRSTRSKAAPEFKMTYVVVACEEVADSAPFFSILATSGDLELANELAIKHFRDACSRPSRGITAETRRLWAKSVGAGNQSGAFNWKLDKDACIQLDTTMPMSDRRITVRVDAKRLSARLGR
ncbi:hypothetical protein F5X97DRAFT_224437 [Nemania serpens]|nr:hypothetical protein F5X97DRAFT_224437 [Nemania serpens]